jgi:Cathepsin propeptide inhibitor domain (I29)
MKIIVAATLLSYASAIQLVSQQDNDEHRFAAWAANHNRHYSSVQEHSKRFKEWQRSAKEVASINADHSNTFKAGLNNFADWTQEEYQALLSPGTAFVEDKEDYSFAEVFGKPTSNPCSTCGTTCGSSLDYGKGKVDSLKDHRPANYLTSWPAKD